MGLTCFDFDYMQQWAQCSTLADVATDVNTLQQRRSQQRQQDGPIDAM